MGTVGFLVTQSRGLLQSRMADTMTTSRYYHFMKYWADTLITQLAMVLV